MNITALIIDDESLARRRIISLLNDIDEIDIVGQCRNGQEAIDSIKKVEPDLIFLDIQMPEISGFDVLDQLDKLPLIIFVTAYDKYAIQAFDYHAIDYLLKPYKDSRFYEALSYATKLIQLNNLTGFHQKLDSLLTAKKNNTHNFNGIDFEIKLGGRIVKINSNTVDWINAEGNYVGLNYEGKTHLYRSTISTLEFDLQDQNFIRIHRSILINVASIERISYLNSNNQYKFKLHNGSEFHSARSYKDRLIEYIDMNDSLLIS